MGSSALRKQVVEEFIKGNFAIVVDVDLLVKTLDVLFFQLAVGNLGEERSQLRETQRAVVVCVCSLELLLDHFQLLSLVLPFRVVEQSKIFLTKTLT